MKKIFFAILMAVIIAGSAFAADAKKVNANVVYSFKSDFKKAVNVSWTTTENFAKAAFTMNGQQMEAFYNTEGERIATSKKITLDELPAEAKRTFTKKFGGYDVKEAIRFEGVDEDAYYISAENEKESVIVKVSSNQSVSIFTRTNK